MKKLLVMCVCLLVATASLFASGGKEREMTFFGGYQGNFYNYEGYYQIDASSYAVLDMLENYQGMAVGFELREMSSDMIGANVSVAVNLPFSVSVGFKDFKDAKVSLKRDDFESLFGIEMFGGLLIRPIRTNKMSLNLTPGIHMSFLSPKMSKNNISYLSYGLGADVSVDFALTQKIFMTAGVTASFDFLSMNEFLKGAKIFAVTPKFGVGFQI